MVFLSPLAHGATSGLGSSPSIGLWTVVSIVAVLSLLFVENKMVRDSTLRPLSSLAPRRRLPIVCVVVAGLALASLPAPADAAEVGLFAGLPDLTATPPFITFEKNVTQPDGSTLRVLSFDGFVANVGEGTLDLAGNPQIEGDVKQRVWDGETWSEVASPTVRYETTDGHDHFHVMGIADYQLWNASRTRVIGDASKVGFCLVDTLPNGQGGPDAYYEQFRFDYCAQNDPETTELRMGITPGWLDLYDAATTLQWVDITDVAPGRYWVSAVTDPNDEIVESDETNNGAVFSANSWVVGGHTARPLTAPVRVDGRTTIDLESDAFGTVAAVVYTITTPPAHGTLDVPTGADVFTSAVTYTPDAGFTGSDSFAFAASDFGRDVPREPLEVIVEVQVDGDGDGDGDGDQPGLTLAPIDAIEVSTETIVEIEIDDSGNDDIEWFGSQMPPGLRIERDTGTIVGVPNATGEWTPTVTAVGPSGSAELDVTIKVVKFPDRPTLAPRNDFSTRDDEKLRLFIGRGRSDASYEADGLPEGMEIDPGTPFIFGTPEESGSFDVEVRELVDGELVHTVTFNWTVRQTLFPAFVL